MFRISDLGGIRKIVLDLHPKWFDKEAIINIPIDIMFQKTFVVNNEGGGYGIY